MECEAKKFYHKHDEFACRALLETYYSNKQDMEFADDALIFPMMKFHYIFSSGFVKGNVLMDLSMGSVIHHLYSACDVFKEIYILKLNEKCKMETSRWKDSHNGAYDWTHASAHASQLEGKSAQAQDKDQQLKAAIRHIIPCNFDNENITHPEELPLADCVTSITILEAISEDEDGLMRNLEKMSKLLRPGGHLVLMVALNASYFVAGGEKVHLLTVDESLIKNALSKLGFVVDYCAEQKRRNKSTLADHTAIMFITACKTK
ncbi:indolethylamine N-methyltransferase-like [Hyperolius riggenbachi]|uniref:indolethylamine N-methyltransferase-like n=1 Tax=Hyperolius riggenbachi TaxID=752182 RepID=UPI0035A2EBF9